MKLGLQFLARRLPKCRLEEATGILAFRTSEPLGFNGGTAIFGNDDADAFQLAPPTQTTSLTEPSASICSVTL